MSKLLQFILVVTGISVGLLLTAQIRTFLPAFGSFPLDQIETKNELIKAYTDEQALQKSQIIALRDEISRIQEEMQQYYHPEDVDRLNQLKRELGLTEITGEGLEIVLDDSPEVKREILDVNDDALIHAADLRDLINVLRAVKPEAIAVNNQRIVISTPINCVGNSILVNNFHMLPPFTVAVIGDSKLIFAKLTDENVLKDLNKRVEKNGVIMKMKPKGEMTIPMYSGTYQSKYLKKYEGF